MKTYQATVEINEVDTLIEVDYEMQFGIPEIWCILNLETKEIVEVSEIDNIDMLNEELYEWAQNEEQIALENHYENV